MACIGGKSFEIYSEIPTSNSSVCPSDLAREFLDAPKSERLGGNNVSKLGNAEISSSTLDSFVFSFTSTAEVLSLSSATSAS